MRVFTRFLSVVFAANVEFAGFRNQKKYTAYDSFHGNSPYGEIMHDHERANQNGRINLKPILPYNN